MPTCKHSWCHQCNHQMNKNKINKCPLCNKKFKSLLVKGIWKYNKKKKYWVWHKGIQDSSVYNVIKKGQQYLLNICGGRDVIQGSVESLMS